MTLLAVEIRRGLVRRSTRVLVAIAIGFVAFMGIIVFLSSRAEYDESTRLAEAIEGRESYVNDCVATRGFGGEVDVGPGQELRSACAETAGPLSDFTNDKRFKLTNIWDGQFDSDQAGDDDSGVLAVTAIFLVIGALIGGATFIGGDWRYGTVGTLLTWEPRRVRVFVAKAAAAAIVSFVIGVLLQSLAAASLVPSAVWRGTTEGADGAWFVGLVGAILRTSGLGTCAALVGFAVAFIGRNTSAALGLAFGYVAIFEALVRGLKPQWQRWLIGENSTVFLFGKLPEDASFDRTVVEAVVILGVYLAALLVLSATVFNRRDVAA